MVNKPIMSQFIKNVFMLLISYIFAYNANTLITYFTYSSYNLLVNQQFINILYKYLPFALRRQ